MRIYVLLIVAAIALSFSTAYYAVNMQKQTSADTNEIIAIQKSKKDFEESARPTFEIDLSSMYPSKKYVQLLQPQSAFSREATSSKTFFSRPCENGGEKMSKLASGKSETWEDFRCNRINELPEKFFENSPLVHENGLSFAFLAYLSGRSPFYNSEWVRANLNLFHIYELEELPRGGLEGNFKILSQLKKLELEGIVRGSLYVLTDDYFFIRDRQDFNVTYKLYNREDFENFLKGKNYYLRDYKENKDCFFREGLYCWEKDSGSVISFFMKSSIFIFTGSVIVLLLVAVILYKKIKLQSFEEERKKHALRVLTHELRTPIANLLLMVEEISKHTDDIKNPVLEEFLKMEGEIYRLKRLAEKSTSYLQTHDGASLFAISLQDIPSVSEFINDSVHDYLEKGVFLKAPHTDSSFRLDPYWFDICLKNLIENALNHGKAPITVKWIVTDLELQISVTDAGDCAYNSLDELISSDRTGKNSRGLGLGLNIVQKIMKDLDGKLSYNEHPTTFSLFLRNKK
ncbi:MAG: HAMP domain-containing histidine kinase [Bdellovibrionales bacterium]|nr:HAMP domain-containing histidine kinase [Bdellovibrionales bacterium]